MMKTKLAGHLPLQDMVQRTIERARSQMQIKTASEERKEEMVEEKVQEKVASAINPFDPTEIEKLASALEFAAEELTKEADGVVNGGESKQGGEQIANNGPVGGTQPYKKDKAKHQIPAPTTKSTKDNPGPANAMKTDDERAPGGTGAKYPAEGPLRKKAAVADLAAKAGGHLANVGARVANVARVGGPVTKGTATALGAGAYGAGALAAGAAGKAAFGKNKKSSAEAAEYVLGKLAESAQGGLTLDSKSESGAKPNMSADGRSMIASNSAPKDATKAKAKSFQKVLLKEVLTEPAQTKATDSKVHENLRNASKGGVKIAAARAILQKIAEEGCKCDGKGDCKHCKMNASMKAKKEEKTE
jgi:hypothetical protein